MSAKHTPGPWQAEPSCPQDGVNCFFIVAADRMQIGSVDGYQSEPMREANANLVAAAPDLLEALQEADIFVAVWASHYQHAHGLSEIHPRHAAIIKRVKDAIAKATGEDQ